MSDEIFNVDGSDLFPGSTSARNQEYHYFSDLSFIPNSDNRPAIVFPDGHIFLETFSPFYNKAVDFVVAIAEPCSRPKYMEEYQISPNSLFAGVSIGLTAREIIRVLGLISKTPLTENFKKKLEFCCQTIGKLNLVLKDQRYFIESSEITLLQKLLANPFFEERRCEKKQKGDKLYENTKFLIVDDDEIDAIISGVGEASYYASAERLTEGLKLGEDMIEMEDKDKPTFLRFEVKQDSINEIREYCFQKNIFLTEEYDFMHDPKLPSINASLKSETTIRPYQEKALTKMFSGGRAKSCIIVLPCGAGKTLLGIAAIVTINKPAVIVCNSILPVHQWYEQIQQHSNIDRKLVIKFTGEDKMPLPEGPCIVITTYSMVTGEGKKAKDTLEIMGQIKSRDWGILVLDEVQEAAAKTFRNVTKEIHSHTRLGLTATMVREDEKIGDLKYLVGPKLYEANWIELAENGFLARVQCYEVIVPMTAAFYQRYLETDDIRKSLILAAANPNKINMLESLIQYHENKGDKILVFCDSLAILIPLASKLARIALHGDTKNEYRQSVFSQFKNGNRVNTIILSSIGDKALNLPSANVLIQISSQYGARMQESQRLGRVLRPKPGKNSQYNSFFYSIVSDDTVDIFYSAKRQQYLVDQGYSYEPVRDGEKRWPARKQRQLDSAEEQEKWLKQILDLKEMSEISELNEESSVEGSVISKKSTSAFSGSSTSMTFVNIV